MRAERKPSLTLSYPGRVTTDQGIVKILTPLHHVCLSMCFWHLSCSKLREHAMLSIPRISTSGVLCLQISKPLSKGRSIIVFHLTEEKYNVAHPRSWQKAPMQISCWVFLPVFAF